jgi:hypothetical protein
MLTPVWVELGIASTTEDVLISDAWPRKVTRPVEPARLAVTQLLDFIAYAPTSPTSFTTACPYPP